MGYTTTAAAATIGGCNVIVGFSAAKDTAQYCRKNNNDKDRDTNFYPVAHATLFGDLLRRDEASRFCIIRISCSIRVVSVQALLARIQGAVTRHFGK